MGSGTPIPLGFTTTIRPPGQTPSTSGFLSGRNLKALSHEGSSPFEQPAQQQRSFPLLGQDGRKPKVKSNLKAKLRNFGGRNNFANSDSALRKKFRSFDSGFEKRRFRTQLEVDTTPPRFEEADPSAPETTTEYFPEIGPEVRPDGREPRVKADLLAEIQHKPETLTVQPFIETFFASPSSPKPFIFRGSPTPQPFGNDLFGSPSSPQPFIFRGSPNPYEEDLFGSASTVQPFFSPTVKPPTFTGITKTPFLSLTDAISDSVEPSLDSLDAALNINEIEEDTSPFQPPVNRFKSRPSPSRFERKRGQTPTPWNLKQDAKIEENEEEVFADDAKSSRSNQLSSEQKPQFNSNVRQHKKKLAEKIDEKENNLISEDECDNPFRCPSSTGLPRSHSPRVKSNIRARNRNFWQESAGSSSNSEFGRNRQVRKGRKQKVVESQNLVEDQVEKENEESNEMEASEEEKEELEDTEETEPFVPTVRTETTVAPPKQEEDLFEDIFEQDDLIVASSTVSSVVFKGSPTPSFGFFSSPGPDFDTDSGVFRANARPSFSNIGNNIDLGPRKFLSPDQPVFVTSTESNKIFIGASEETTVEQATSTTVGKKPFPSFPIRGGLGPLTFPSRAKPGFFASKPLVENKQNVSAKIFETEITTEELELATTTPSSPPTASRFKSPAALSSRFKPFNRFAASAKGSFNSFFNRKRPGAQVETTEVQTETETEPTVTENLETDSQFDVTTEAILSPVTENLETIETDTRKDAEEITTQISSLRKSPFNFRPKLGLKTKTGGRIRPLNREVKEPEPEYTTEGIVSSVDPVIEQVTESSVLSVESELFLEEELLNEIPSGDSKDETQPEATGFRRFPGVQKARQPPNANVRVEFKKAPSQPEEQGKKFFVKPDGRRPRVKSNIRARLANKGQFLFDKSEPIGFHHSTKVDEEFEFNGDPELEHKDNTEKREINPNDLNLNTESLDSLLQGWENKERKFQLNSNTPAPPQPFQFVQSETFPSPSSPSTPEILDPEPLTPDTQPSNSQTELLEQIVVKHGETTPPPYMDADHSSSEVESSSDTSSESNLSAFRALLSMSRADLPLQLLNTRENLQV